MEKDLSFEDYLKDILDEKGMRYILETLERICDLKCAHVLDNFKDVSIAMQWWNLSKKISNLNNSRAVINCPLP